MEISPNLFVLELYQELIYLFFSFISFISHNIKFTPFITKYKKKIIIIITICGKTYIIDDSNKILLV